MELMIMGIALAFNLLVIKFKFEAKRFGDGLMDLGLLVLIALVFGGSVKGLMIGTVASAIISIVLFFSPPKFQVNIKKKKLFY